MTSAKVIVIGLDCAPASLVLDRLAHRLPFLRAMVRRGVSGVLRSCDPPITVPAWAVMTSGKDAGQLGLYGFRDRIPGARTLRTVSADDLRAPRVWDVLAAAGRRSHVLFAPPSHPPRAAPGVELVSCMLAPKGAALVTAPPSLAAELPFTDLSADVTNDDERDPDTLLSALEAQVERHFDLCEHAIRHRAWDLLMMVEMAPDRLHHALWPALDPSDPRHGRFSGWTRRAEDLYALMDARIARLHELLPDATLLVVSDHGARPIRGGVYVNELLRNAGLLVLRSAPDTPGPLAAVDVDWTRTRAWAEGGYYARVFLNHRSRFDDAPEYDMAATLTELEATLGAHPGGPHRFVRPARDFVDALGQPPDLFVYFGDLALRALGTLGTGSLDASPDEVDREPGRGGCNHDWDGIFLARGPTIAPRRLTDARLIDVGRTLLGALGVPAPEDWQGRDLLRE